MFKKIFLTALGLVLLVGAIVGIKVMQIKTMMAQGAHMTMPPESVSTIEVKEEPWTRTLTAVGSLTAVQGVMMAAELDGKVTGLDFQAGSEVKAGSILVEQDVTVEKAELRSAEAGVTLAKLNRDRSKQLLEKNTVSQAQFDSDSAAFEQAVAAADNIRAVIAKKTIRAPFAGRLGVRLVNLGQSLKAGDTLVSLQALDPIFVDFYLPQQDISNLAPGMEAVVKSDAFPGREVKGKVTAINPDIDTATRNVRVQATVRNDDESLRPGMFVTVAVQLSATNKVLPIPATAVLYAPYGDTVFVVEDKVDPATGRSGKFVRQQVVRLGETRGDFVAVVSGLKAGETVVTSGAFKLRQGTAVSVNNGLAPNAQIAPTPRDT